MLLLGNKKKRMDPLHERGDKDSRSLNDDEPEKAQREQIEGARTASKAPLKLKKHPQAPKRFKSAFILFSSEKHKEIREQLLDKGVAGKTTSVAKLVSEAWRQLSESDRQVWEEKARKDKARYHMEKAMYKGPWKVATQRRLKDPLAPKRPMSAFLAFSNSRRASIKRSNPDASNADISKELSKKWKEAPKELKKKYFDEEAELRRQYKVRIAEWRKKAEEEEKAERRKREDLALKQVDAAEHAASVGSAVAKLPARTEPTVSPASLFEPIGRSAILNSFLASDVLSRSNIPSLPSHLNEQRIHPNLGATTPTLGDSFAQRLRQLNVLNVQELTGGPRLTDSYQPILSSITDGASAHLARLEGRHRPIPDFSSRFSERINEVNRHEQIADHVRTMYPGIGMLSNVGLGDNANFGIAHATSNQNPNTFLSRLQQNLSTGEQKREDENNRQKPGGYPRL